MEMYLFQNTLKEENSTEGKLPSAHWHMKVGQCLTAEQKTTKAQNISFVKICQGVGNIPFTSD